MFEQRSLYIFLSERSTAERVHGDRRCYKALSRTNAVKMETLNERRTVRVF